MKTTRLILRDGWQLSGPLSAHIGARLDRSTDYGTFVNPRVGLDWIAGQYTNVFLLYGESAFPPSEIQQTSNGLFSPLGSDDLDPAKIRLLELAIDHDFRNGVSLASNLFAYEQEDEIGVLPDPTAPIGTRFDNLDEEESGHGAEVLLGWQATPRVHISVGGAFQRTRSDDLGNTGAPELLPYAEVDVGPTRRWTINRRGHRRLGA